MGAAVQQKYTAEDEERALRELAECRGNARLASRRLAARGVEVPHQTLHYWSKDRLAGRFAELLTEVEDRVHTTIAHEYETLALRALEVQNELLGDLSDKRDSLSPKEIATALNATATAGGIATDKSSALRGRPTAIIENRNPYELLSRWMPALKQYVDGEAEEIAEEEPGSKPSVARAEGTAT